MFGTAQLPKFARGPVPHAAIGRRTHWLHPTAEVPLTNLVREAILDEEDAAACATPR